MLATGVAVIVVEGIFIGFSSLAAQDPHVFGLVTVISAPIGLVIHSPEETVGEVLATVAAYEGLGIDNLVLGAGKHSRHDIFWNYMIGWHVIMGVAAISVALFGKKNDESKASGAVEPSWSPEFGVSRGTLNLGLTYRWGG